jgi:hypothetical protein
MVMQWHQVCGRPISESQKAAACSEIFQSFIGRLALIASRTPNPAERFYAYMWSLAALVKPDIGSGDHLGQMAIHPSHNLLQEWLASNNVSRL